MDTSTVISLVSLVISSFVLFRDYLLPAKIDVFVGDSLQIVHGDRNKIQLNFNLTNSRNKLSVINRLQAVLTNPKGHRYSYEWNLFYRLETNEVRYNQFVTSIAVLAKNNVFQGIEFIASRHFAWVAGRYEFEIQGWSNRGMNEQINLTKQISFSLSNDDVAFLEEVPYELGDSIPMRKVKIIN